jgi:hypothetical protein
MGDKELLDAWKSGDLKVSSLYCSVCGRPTGGCCTISESQLIDLLRKEYDGQQLR